MINTRFREEYRFLSGRRLRIEGTILTIFEGAAPLDRPETTVRFTEIQLPDIEVQDSVEGVTLTINDLNFRPDSAELLPSETPRLDVLAQALLTLPDRSFLVVGHAAATGRPEGEMQLSIDRAQVIAEALERRGVPAERLIFEGRGSTEPVMSNDTEAGRARNRRVEIIIME